MSSRIVCVTGPDGTGKSTLIRHVVEALDARHGAHHAVHVQVWDSLRPLITREVAQDYLARIDHRSRALLLLHAVSRSLALGQASGAPVVLVDGYWYKYAVSELEQGTPAAVFAGCAEAFPRPDLTVVLELPIAETLRRKSHVTAYERGFGAESEAAFVAFQQRLRDRWAAMEAAHGPWMHLSSEASPEALAARVVTAIDALPGTRS